MRLLLVEDDKLLGDGIRAGLMQAGFGVEWTQTYETAKLATSIEVFDVIILDLGLPDGSGLDILRALRNEKKTTPVLILTARDTLTDKLKGLDGGADDYLVKPFDLQELTARIRALLRRSNHRATNTIDYHGISLDTVSRLVSIHGKPVELPLREFNLLENLLENQGRVLTRAQLEQNLYGWNADVESNAIEVHVHHIRKKLGSDIIKTIRGVGYTIPKR